MDLRRFSDILNGKLDRLEMMEASDGDQDTDVGRGSDQSGRRDLLEQARSLDPHDPKVTGFIRVLLDKNKRPNNKVLVSSTFRHTLAYLDVHARNAGCASPIHGDVLTTSARACAAASACPRRMPMRST